MRVYVIRHGESETNRDKKWTGWLDVKLTDKGKDDAKKAGALLKGTSFEKIFSSDLIRAVETAKNAIPDCLYETSSLLREINVGSLADNPLNILTDEQHAKSGKNGYAEYGGETKADFRARIRQFMKMLEESEYENVAVFSHAGWLCGMLDIVADIYIPRNRLCCENCTVAIFEYTNNAWKLHSWINPV